MKRRLLLEKLETRRLLASIQPSDANIHGTLTASGTLFGDPYEESLDIETNKIQQVPANLSSPPSRVYLDNFVTDGSITSAGREITALLEGRSGSGFSTGIYDFNVGDGQKIVFDVVSTHPNDKPGDTVKLALSYDLILGSQARSESDESAPLQYVFQVEVGDDATERYAGTAEVLDPDVGGLFDRIQSPEGLVLDAAVGDKLEIDLQLVGSGAGGGGHYVNVSVDWSIVTPNIYPQNASLNDDDQTFDFSYRIQGGDLDEIPSATLLWRNRDIGPESDVPITTVELPSKAVGSHDASVPLADIGSPPAGADLIVLSIDHADLIAEKAEYDNELTVGIVGNYVYSFSAQSDEQLDSVRFTYDLGSFPPTDSFQVQFYGLPDLDYEQLGWDPTDEDSYFSVLKTYGERINDTVTVSPASFDANERLSLRNESNDEALKAGLHRLQIKANGFPLGDALANSEHELIVAVADFANQGDDVEFRRANSINFAGFYQAADGEPLFMRADLAERDQVTIQQIADRLLIDMSGEDIVLTTAQAPELEIFTIDGDDTITAENSVQVPLTVHAGIGNDTVQGGSAADWLLGGFGKDTLRGGGGDDVVLGQDGDDTRLDGEAGNDIVIGGRGKDTLAGGPADDALLGDGFQLDLPQLPTLLDALSAFLRGEDLEFPTALVPVEGDNDTIDGGAGRDLILGGKGTDTISGGTGDSLIFGDTFSLEITAKLGVENIWTSPTPTLNFADALKLVGEGNDIITGGTGGNIIFGGGGDDTITGSDNGLDLILGQDGKDTIVAKGGLNVVVGGANPCVEDCTNDEQESITVGAPGAAGVNLVIGDSVGLSDEAPDFSLNSIFSAGTALMPGRVLDWFQLTEEGADRVTAIGGSSLVLGGAGNDALIGVVPEEEGIEVGLDVFLGGEGDDALIGLQGSNILIGGNGSDELRGGGDKAANLLVGDNIEINIDLDFANLFKSFVFPSVDESIIKLSGAGDDFIYGGKGFDFIIGGEGVENGDEIHGGDGFNIVFGDGFDVGVLGEIGSAFSFAKDVFFKPFDAAKKVFEKMKAAGEEIIDAVYDHFFGSEGQTSNNSQRDDYYGGSGIDIVFGGGGTDILRGSAGFDFLVGGDDDDGILSGNGDALCPKPVSICDPNSEDAVPFSDFAWGGHGDDTFTGGPDGDLLGSTIGNDTFHGGGGNDFIFAGDGADQLFGEDGDDWLFGEGGTDTLEGGPGADTIISGPGADNIIRDEDDRVDEDAPFHNLVNRFDVNSDGEVTPNDALIVINFLNARLTLPETNDDGHPLVDVTGDGVVIPVDVLVVVNHLNQRQEGEGEVAWATADSRQAGSPTRVAKPAPQWTSAVDAVWGDDVRLQTGWSERPTISLASKRISALEPSRQSTELLDADLAENPFWFE